MLQPERDLLQGRDSIRFRAWPSGRRVASGEIAAFCCRTRIGRRYARLSGVVRAAFTKATALPEPIVDRPLRGIAYKLVSVAAFIVMSSMVKMLSEIPLGEVIFLRTLFAAVFIMLLLAANGELRTAFRTERLPLHIGRAAIAVTAMVMMFYSITHLPLSEATTMTYTTPLILVVLSGVVLREPVGLYRWSAVIVGLVGVLVISWPRLTFFSTPALEGGVALGTLAAFGAAFLAAVAMLVTRGMVRTESNSTIVLYMSIFSCCFALFSLPLGVVMPTPFEAMLLVGAGIAGALTQFFLTASYRYAHVTVIAPFDYASLLLSIAVGFVIFAEIPTANMLAGALIVVAAGIFIIYREHKLGVERAAAHAAPHT